MQICEVILKISILNNLLKLHPTYLATYIDKIGPTNTLYALKFTSYKKDTDDSGINKNLVL